MCPEQNKGHLSEGLCHNAPDDAPALPSQVLAQPQTLEKLPDFPVNLQALPSRQAQFCLGIERFLTRDLGLGTRLKGSRIILGLSGGADSTALLLILHYLKPRLGFELLPAHLDHSLRPESGLESSRVRELCSSLNLPCFFKKLDVDALAKQQSLGLEEAGRLARYEFFASLASETSPNHASQTAPVFIVTAHHLDDLAEDLLLRLVRGSGWPALAGMKALLPLPESLAGSAPKATTLLRPLLLNPKSELTGFLEQLHCPWIEDSSNAALDFKRNRMRNQIMPLLLRENPAFRDSIANLWRLGQLDEEHWDQQLAEFQGAALTSPGVNATAETDSAPAFFIPRDTLLGRDQATRMRLYKACLQKLGPGQVIASNLFKLDASLLERKSGKIFSFPGYKKIKVEREGLKFYLNKQSR